MHRSPSTKPLSSSISQSYPISNTPPVHENCSPPPPNYNLHITPHNNLFLVTPNHLHYHTFHISLILLLLMILMVTIPLMIPPYKKNGSQQKFILYSTTN